MQIEKVIRPWGYFVNIIEENGYKVKQICILPGKRLSLQSHFQRSEHWVVVQGIASVQIGADIQKVHVNQHIYVPKEVEHRIENKTSENVVIIETQIGNYLGEDDIIRHEDDYGRT